MCWVEGPGVCMMKIAFAISFLYLIVISKYITSFEFLSLFSLATVI